MMSFPSSSHNNIWILQAISTITNEITRRPKTIYAYTTIDVMSHNLITYYSEVQG